MGVERLSDNVLHVDLSSSTGGCWVKEFTGIIKDNLDEELIQGGYENVSCQLVKGKNEVRVKIMKDAEFNRVYTSGCFDIFHHGHLNILRNSKKLCNHLVVGVSTDELILKEKGRLPVIPFKERMDIVSSIEYVDEVIPQTDKNKQKIVDLYNINAITVGDDWKGRFPHVSCEVVYFTYTPSVSSTLLKKALSLKAG